MEDPDMHEMWLQQDGALVHTARVSIEMLKVFFFSNCLVSCFGDIP